MLVLLGNEYLHYHVHFSDPLFSNLRGILNSKKTLFTVVNATLWLYDIIPKPCAQIDIEVSENKYWI